MISVLIIGIYLDIPSKSKKTQRLEEGYIPAESFQSNQACRSRSFRRFFYTDRGLKLDNRGKRRSNHSFDLK